MVKKIEIKGLPAYECEACGFHYKSQATAKKCESFCRRHGGCSMEITKGSMERKGLKTAVS